MTGPSINTPNSDAAVNNPPDLAGTQTWSLLQEHGQRVPEHLWPAIVHYVEYGRRYFVIDAIFENDLRNAISFADTPTLHALGPIVRFIYRHLPSDCNGSVKAVLDWSEQGGLAGLRKVAA